eukprot:TRINITY_DN18107_c0_g1_i1.p1 TRINITY_DN18107_c0_g1~~TRINITY_DN18107_c0_g1_i1.p1  ORF type:complete len:614 (+),score=164.95 TRINITY_DN18107_c0_g1_i1:128-1969(+)
MVHLPGSRPSSKASAKATMEDLDAAVRPLLEEVNASKAEARQQMQRFEEMLAATAGGLDVANQALAATESQLQKTFQQQLESLKAELAADAESARVALQKGFREELESSGRSLQAALESTDGNAVELRRRIDELRGQLSASSDAVEKSLGETAQRVAEQALSDLQAATTELKAQLRQEAARLEEQLLSEADKADVNVRSLELKVQKHIADSSLAATEDRKRAEAASAELSGRLDQVSEALRAALAENVSDLAAKICSAEAAHTRRVEWVIEDACSQLAAGEREAEVAELESPRSKVLQQLGKCTSVFSPRFDAAGARDLQLELRCFSSGGSEQKEQGDCAVLLWASGGVSMVYRLSVGSKSQTFETLFEGRNPCGTQRFCSLREEVDETGSLNVSVDILECLRRQERDALLLEGSESHPATKLSGSLVCHSQVNHRQLEEIKLQVDHFRSRMVRKVEWKLQNASRLQQMYPTGEAARSREFDLAGIEGMQLIFYPAGLEDSVRGYCSMFLSAPAGVTLKCWIQVGQERRELAHTFNKSGCFGRRNFCRLQRCIEASSDSLLVSIEIEVLAFLCIVSLAVGSRPEDTTSPRILRVTPYIAVAPPSFRARGVTRR